MRTKYILLNAFFVAVFCIGISFAQEERSEADYPEHLASIASSVESHRGKNITMILKLKKIDRIFESITFYDSNNHDIVFDISGRKKMKFFAPALLNAHEGMNYSVTFTVSGTGNLGLVTGELVSFEPVILDLLP